MSCFCLVFPELELCVRLSCCGDARETVYRGCSGVINASMQRLMHLIPPDCLFFLFLGPGCYLDLEQAGAIHGLTNISPPQWKTLIREISLPPYWFSSGRRDDIGRKRENSILQLMMTCKLTAFLKAFLKASQTKQAFSSDSLF